jgi:hypothetical protein
MTLYDQIKEQADTIEMLSGQRPVGIRLKWYQIEQLQEELKWTIGKVDLGQFPYIHGLRIEVIDD